MAKKPAKEIAPAAPLKKVAPKRRAVAAKKPEPVEAVYDENSAFYPNGQIKPFLPIAPAPITEAKSIEHHHRAIHPDWFEKPYKDSP